MRQSATPQKVPVVSLRDLFHAWYETIELPKVEGHRMHWLATKVRQGEQHVASAWQHVVDDLTARGVPLDVKLGAVRALETYVRATDPARVRHVDLRGAIMRETLAVGRVDPLQVRTWNVDDVDDVDLDRTVAFMGEQIDASMQYRDALLAEQARRVAARAEARRRLFA